MLFVNMQMSQITWPSPYEGEQWPAFDVYISRPPGREFCTVTSGCMVSKEANQSKHGTFSLLHGPDKY